MTPTHNRKKKTPTINNQCPQLAISRLLGFLRTVKDFIENNNAFHMRLNEMTVQQF
jgi:hypothetical protein